MITGIHAMFFSPEAEAIREFLRDKLGLPSAETKDGWPIFSLGEGELGAHPSDETLHRISLYCDDIEATMSQLESRGVEFTPEVEERAYGRITWFKMPGGIEVQLFEPSYARAAA